MKFLTEIGNMTNVDENCFRILDKTEKILSWKQKQYSYYFNKE